MNKNPISPSELSIIKKELNKCQTEKLALGRKLGKLMATSGSFAAKTPGYSEIENVIRVFEGKIEQYSQILNYSILIKGINDLPKDRISIYSKVVAEDTNGDLKRYYICHLPSNSNIKNAIAVTPRSPIGMALIGKRCDDAIQVVLPKGKIELTILSHEIII